MERLWQYTVIRVIWTWYLFSLKTSYCAVVLTLLVMVWEDQMPRISWGEVNELGCYWHSDDSSEGGSSGSGWWLTAGNWNHRKQNWWGWGVAPLLSCSMRRGLKLTIWGQVRVERIEVQNIFSQVLSISSSNIWLKKKKLITLNPLEIEDYGLF